MSITLCLVLITALYARGALRVRRAKRLRHVIEWWEAIAFGAGTFTMAMALAPPLDTLAEHWLSAHMVQHETLMLVAAPLIVLGQPLVALLSLVPRHARPRVTRVTHALMPGPIVAWMLHAFAIWLWHIPVLYDLAVRVPAVHALEHGSFVGTAAMFWWALLRGPYARSRFGLAALAIFTTALHTGLLGVLMLFSRRPWYSVYDVAGRRFSLDALQDQQLAGLIMWIPAGVLLTAAGITCVALWLRSVERRQTPRRTSARRAA